MQYYHKLAASSDVFEDIIQGAVGNTVRTGTRMVPPGKLMIHEVNDGQDTGRYASVILDRVRHTTIAELTDEEMTANGFTKEKEDAIIAGLAAGCHEDVGCLIGLDKMREDAENHGLDRKRFAFLMEMREFYPDLGWNSRISVISFGDAKEVDAITADAIAASSQRAVDSLKASREVVEKGLI